MSTLDIIKSYDGSSDNQGGGELAYFTGRQYGSGWLRTLGRIAFPILKKVARVAGNVAHDALERPDKPILSSIRDNAIKEVASSINTTRKRKVAPTPPLTFYNNNNKKRRRRR